MGRDIPPFAALRAFEALARRASLRAAGEELGISASAVSHQLNALEDNLGKKLLFKRGNRLHFTEAGRCLATELGEGLDLLEKASQRASGRHRTAHITISMFQSLSELWMVPLLAAFHRRSPEITVSVITEPEVHDTRPGNVDLAICYDRQSTDKSGALLLMPEIIEPVASQDYLSGAEPICRPADIVGHRLIHCSSAPDEWQHWSKHKGIALSGASHWLQVDTRAAALQAAEQGLGLAMARKPLADLALSRRKIVEVFNDPLASGMGYYLASVKHTAPSSHIVDFRGWLQDMAQLTNPFSPHAGEPARAAGTRAKIPLG